jgi:hypothetical protein
MAQYLNSLSQGPTLTLASPMTNFGASARPSYYLIGYHTTNSVYGYVPYDAEFRALQNSPSDAGSPTAGVTYGYNQTGNTFTGPTSSSGNFMGGANTYGEYGGDNHTLSERGILTNCLERGYGNVLVTANRSFINADIADRNRTLMMWNGSLWSSPLWALQNRSFFAAPTRPDVYAKTFTAAGLVATGSQIASANGSASYNQVRKELVVTAYNTTVAGQFDVYIWKNIDLNANPDVSLIPDRPTVTLTWNMTAVTGNGWGTTSNQELTSYPRVVLCDDGTIYHVAMTSYSTSTALNGTRVYRLARNADDSALNVTLPYTQGCSNAYGVDQGQPYGLRAMQTKDGRTVALYNQYYYYGSGLNSFFIDKRTAGVTTYQWASSNPGASIVKYRDDGFGVMPIGNVSYGSTTGLTVQIVRPGGSGANVGPTRVSGPSLSVFPGPTTTASNPTNYPGLYPVWELNLQGNLPV